MLLAVWLLAARTDALPVVSRPTLNRRVVLHSAPEQPNPLDGEPAEPAEPIEAVTSAEQAEPSDKAIEAALNDNALAAAELVRTSLDNVDTTYTTFSKQPDRDAAMTPPAQPAQGPSFRTLLLFTVAALPIFISPTLLSLIDTAAVGVGAGGMLNQAALGPGCAVCDSLTALMVFVSISTTNAVSSALGRNDLSAAKRATGLANQLSVVIGVVLAVALAAGAGPAFALLGGDPAQREVFHKAAEYVAIRGLSFPATLVTMATQAAVLGTKDSLAPTVAVAIASGVNIVGDYLLTIRLQMGVAGAAWATVGCQYVAAACLLATAAKKGLVDWAGMRVRPTRQQLRDFFAFGPFIFVVAMKLLTYNAAVGLAAVMGPVASAAHQIMYSLARLCFTIGDVISSTSQAFLPQFIKTVTLPDGTVQVVSDNRAAQPTVVKLLLLAFLVALASNAIVLSVPWLKPDWFTNEPSVGVLMGRVAPWAAAGLCMHGSIVGMEGVLLARRDIKWLLASYAIGGVGSFVAFNQIRQTPGAGLVALWQGLLGWQVYRFCLFLWRIFDTPRSDGSGNERGTRQASAST